MNAREKFLLDTNVISEMGKLRPNAQVMKFLDASREALFSISVMTLGELWKGAAKKRREGTTGADILWEWVEGIERSFASRVLAIDAETARLWGEWSAGRSRPVIDTLIAATAVRHGLTLVTRNVADVAGLPVKTLNPWED